MKKLFLILILFTLSVKYTYALDISLKITSQTASIIGELKIKNDFSSPQNNDEYRAMKYNNIAVKFDNLPNTFTLAMVDNKIQIDRLYEYNGQCVSFVKALTDNPNSTQLWVKGAKIVPNTSLLMGTAIATFSKNGGTKYNAGGKGAHTGIFLASTNDYILIFDQNWQEFDIYGDSGTVGIHRIYFTGKGGVSDAYSYYVINKY